MSGTTKSPLALRTISEAADQLGVQQHVLRFWETKFPFIRPTKRAGGRRFYRPQDIELLTGVKTLLYDRGYTIRGVQKLFKDEGQRAILGAANDQHGSLAPDPHLLDDLPTESGVVPGEDVPADYAAEVAQRGVSARIDYGSPAARGMSEETRQRFLEIAKRLESAQAALGRGLSRR
jgi:DNA-binding transcriptional MerR regulator